MQSTLRLCLSIIVVFHFSQASSAAQSVNWIEHNNFDTPTTFALKGTDLWVLTSGGLVQYDINSAESRTFSASSLHGRPHQPLVVGADGNLWMAAAEGQVLMFDGTEWHAHQLSIPNSQARGAIQAIAVGNNGLVWASMSGFDENLGRTVSHLFQYNGTEWTFLSDDPGWQAIAGLEELLTDPAGNLWGRGHDPVNKKRGLIVSLSTANFIEFYTVENGLPVADDDSRIMDIDLSEDGKVWCAGRGGIAQFANGQWIRTPREFDRSKPGLHLSPINVQAQLQEKLWVHNFLEVSHFDGQQWILFDEIPGLASPASILQLIPMNDGGALLATTVGLFRFDGAWRRLGAEDGIPEGIVKKVQSASDGALYAIIDDITYRIDPSTNQAYLVDNTPHSGAINDVAFDANGDLWVAYACNINKARYGIECGIGRFDGESWQLFGQEQGVSVSEVHSIAGAANGSVWFTTKGGLVRFHENAWDQITPGTPQDEDLLFEAVTIDVEGHVWASYSIQSEFEFGVYKYDGNTWEHYGSEEGIESRVIRIYQAPDGQMWAVAEQYIDFEEGVFRGGLLRLSGNRWETFDLGGADALSDKQKYPGDLVFDSDMNPIVQVNRNLLRFDRSGGWELLKTTDGEVIEDVSRLIQQSTGTIWMAGKFGLAQFESGTLTPYAPDIPVAPATIAIDEKAGDIWISSNTSLFQADGILNITGVNEDVSRLSINDSKLYPQPLNKRILRVSFAHCTAGSVRFDIVDAQGKTVRSNLPSQRDSDTVFTLDLNGVSPGFYFLKITCAESINIKKLLVH